MSEKQEYEPEKVADENGLGGQTIETIEESVVENSKIEAVRLGKDRRVASAAVIHTMGRTPVPFANEPFPPSSKQRSLSRMIPRWLPSPSASGSFRSCSA